MAAANYRLCDKCKAKTFYDSDVDYEDSNLGAMTALCKDCAQVYEITIAKRGGVAELRAALVKMVDQVGYRTLDWAGTVCSGCGADQPNGEHWDDCAVLEAEAALDATEGQP